MAYTPGVAEPCKEIFRDPDEVYSYTAKGNLVAVITNGTAVLGLGDIGPLASKPVMEGKAVLFKKFADIDCFDIELDAKDPERFIDIVAAMEPTFGGINLEDIKAPECFDIERRLKERMQIPVFHDDQHGTAIISGAALMNALELSGKKIGDVRVVFCGGGAASISVARFWLTLGVKLENRLLKMATSTMIGTAATDVASGAMSSRNRRNRLAVIATAMPPATPSTRPTNAFVPVTRVEVRTSRKLSWN